MANSHIRGPAVNGQGAIIGQRGIPVINFGDAGSTQVLLKTLGATVKKPILIKVYSVVNVVFDGTGASLLIKTVDAAGTVVTAGTVDLTTVGNLPTTIMATADLTIEAVFVPGTTPTTGVAGVFAQIAQCGQLV